jgi:hypothetical protein
MAKSKSHWFSKDTSPRANRHKGLSESWFSQTFLRNLEGEVAKKLA